MLNLHNNTDFFAICDLLYRHLSGEMKLEGYALESKFNSVMEYNYSLYYRGNRAESLFADVPELTMDMVREVFNKYFDTDKKLMAKYGEKEFCRLRSLGFI